MNPHMCSYYHLQASSSKIALHPKDDWWERSLWLVLYAHSTLWWLLKADEKEVSDWFCTWAVYHHRVTLVSREPKFPAGSSSTCIAQHAERRHDGNHMPMCSTWILNGQQRLHLPVQAKILKENHLAWILNGNLIWNGIRRRRRS